MLFGETVAVYCETHTEHTDTVRTSQETHYVSATEPNRLMLFREIFAVYCENHTEHTDTVRTSQETHYVSATEPNRLMLFGETVSVYCENHRKHRCVHRIAEWRECRPTCPANLILLDLIILRYALDRMAGWAPKPFSMLWRR
jgi:thioredoxin-related protein